MESSVRPADKHRITTVPGSSIAHGIVPGFSHTGLMGLVHMPLHLQTSVIQASHMPSTSSLIDDAISDEEARKRRELLARRPSYRKILNDLSGVEMDIKHEMPSNDTNDDSRSHSSSQDCLGGPIDHVGSGREANNSLADSLANNYNGDISNSGISGLLGSVLTPASLKADLHHQIRLPVTGGSDLLSLRSVGHPSTSPSLSMSGGQLVPSPIDSTLGMNDSPIVGEEAKRKREVRLLKNREAAKECRRKKKEYVRCLENRVAVLENQNKALIEELKTLKELYCRKGDG